MIGAAAVVGRARALVGTRFRPQGRRPEHGLDCVRLVALAAELPQDMVPTGYSLTTEAGGALLSSTFGGRLKPVAPEDTQAGDVLLVRANTCRSHFLVLVEGGFIHADAISRRVVERPGAVPWPVVAAWRVRESG